VKFSALLVAANLEVRRSGGTRRERKAQLQDGARSGFCSPTPGNIFGRMANPRNSRKGESWHVK
jgi:hypothetical protein